VSERSGDEAAAERLADLEAKLEELRRVNAELGRELRRAAVSRQPRSPAAGARALAKLANERDTARAELEQTKAELVDAEARREVAEHGVEDLRERFEGLHVETEHLRYEAVRLRSGGAGLLRRLRARLLRR
jgi:chromosome segregation ATPase